MPDEITAAENAVLPVPELIRLLTTVTEARHRPHNVTVAAARNPAIPAAVMDDLLTARDTGASGCGRRRLSG